MRYFLASLSLAAAIAAATLPAPAAAVSGPPTAANGLSWREPPARMVILRRGEARAVRGFSDIDVWRPAATLPGADRAPARLRQTPTRRGYRFTRAGRLYATWTRVSGIVRAYRTVSVYVWEG